MTQSEQKSLHSFMTTLAFPDPDVRIMEDFHESTKIHPQTIEMDGLWIGSYLSDPRALLETASNKKRYFLSEPIELPAPTAVPGALAQALRERSTAARFAPQPFTLDLLSSLLSASMKPTRVSLIDADRDLRLHKRPYASGGGLYPIEVYPVLLSVEGHMPTVTHYDAVGHRLSVIRRYDDDGVILASISDVDARLASAGVVFLFTAVLPRTTVKYGTRGYRFAMIEAGEIAQNLSLCAQALGLATLPWGGYFDDDVARMLKVNVLDEVPIHCLAVGHSG